MHKSCNHSSTPQLFLATSILSRLTGYKVYNLFTYVLWCFQEEGYLDVSRTSLKKSCNQPLVKYSGSEKFLCPFKQNTHYVLRRVFLAPRWAFFHCMCSTEKLWLIISYCVWMWWNINYKHIDCKLICPLEEADAFSCSKINNSFIHNSYGTFGTQAKNANYKTTIIIHHELLNWLLKRKSKLFVLKGFCFYLQELMAILAAWPHFMVLVTFTCEHLYIYIILSHYYYCYGLGNPGEVRPLVPGFNHTSWESRNTSFHICRELLWNVHPGSKGLRNHWANQNPRWYLVQISRWLMKCGVKCYGL
jgi:hypothetical protein